MTGPGPRIAEARQKVGWSQTELARRSGVTQQGIARLEAHPEVTANLDTLVKLSTALGIPVSSLAPEGAGVQLSEKVLPRTMQAIPLNAPKEVVEKFDRQISEVARMIFGTDGVSVPNALPAAKNGAEKDGSDDAEGSKSGDGFFIMNKLVPLGHLFFPGESPVCALVR